MNKRASYSLAGTIDSWTTYDRIKYDVQTERAWSNRAFVARPLSTSWQRRFVPTIAISTSRLIYSAGKQLHIFQFTPPPSLEAPHVTYEGACEISRPKTGAAPDSLHDITCMGFLPGDREHSTLIIGFVDGAVKRAKIPTKFDTLSQSKGNIASADLEDMYANEAAIESLSISGTLSVTVSGTGDVELRDHVTGSSSSIQLGLRSWSTYLSSSGSSAYAAFGTSSSAPLSIHPLTESALLSKPSFILSSEKFQRDESANSTTNPTPSEILARIQRSSSAVYGLCDSPPSLCNTPGQTLVSGWFDGIVRVYDLRSSRRLSPTTLPNPGNGSSSVTVPTLAPVMTMYDPWSTEPIYTMASGGGAGYTIAAGTARHSVVSFWDVRQPRDGWSVHAPGNDSSPVYSIVLESSRLFGASQSRPFVYDFGPGVTRSTYPAITHSKARVDNSLKPVGDGINYRVMTYRHKRGVVDSNRRFDFI